ncbi:hypothetical protein FB451DRAFT_1167825 [Mycena latifolia]|nr:hypothetical protein FB451DRAFT_1167825 [Mycena latifolia]
MAGQTVFNIQELCDNIGYYISLHPSSHNDLKSTSTALVSRRLSASVQSHIFRHITLDPSAGPGPYVHDENLRREVADSASHRLAVLRASPHLVRYVRHLTVLARAGILKPVLDTHFPHLRKISFNFVDTQWLPDDVSFTRDCIALPSIREVELKHLRGPLQFDQFASLFDGCNNRLDSLAFIGVYPSAPFRTESAPRPIGQRAQIKRLEFIDSALGDWFISPSCPFHFTHLIEVEGDLGSSVMLNVLTSARSTITRLWINSGTLNLSKFPSLTCLELRGSPPGNLMASLKPDNRVKRLVLHIAIPPLDDAEIFPQVAEYWSDIDVFIASLPMPALQRVEVLVRRETANANLGRLRTCFRHLSARGLLALKHDESC